MATGKPPATSSSPTLLGLFMAGLLLMFVAFKLARVGDVAGWSWWWVLAPAWLTSAVKFVLRVVIKLLKRKIRAIEARAKKVNLR